MTNKLTKPGRKLAKYQFFIQLSVVLICAIGSYCYWGWSSFYSAFVGGFIAVIPQSIFAYKAFRFAGGSQSKKVVESFYSGEKLKLMMTVILLAIAFRFLVLDVVPFFTSFSLAVVIPLLTPFFLNFNHWDK